MLSTYSNTNVVEIPNYNYLRIAKKLVVDSYCCGLLIEPKVVYLLRIFVAKVSIAYSLVFSIAKV